MDGSSAGAMCGCCEGPVHLPGTENRPGLPALRYRVSTHSGFLQRMLARLPTLAIASGTHEGIRPLKALTTRARDDAAMALLDAWAVVGDVLTFYQERIANEGFLRPATERRSVLELARTIGYELSPGVAAGTWLAFEVETPVGAPGQTLPPDQRALQQGVGSQGPARAVVPAGTRVQSIPGPGERPQSFETSEALEARPEWNALRPRLTRPQPLDPTSRTVWVEGTVHDLAPGGWVVFLAPGASEGTPGAAGEAGTGLTPVPRQVVSVTPEEGQGRTRLELAGEGSPATYAPPAATGLTYQAATLAHSPLTGVSAEALVMKGNWKQKDLSVFMQMQGWDPRSLKAFSGARRRAPSPVPPPSFQLDAPAPGLHAFTLRVAPFGHNAPRYLSLPEEQRGSGKLYPRDWDTSPPSIAEDSRGNAHRTSEAMGHPHFLLEREVSGVLPAGWILLESGSNRRVLRVAAVREASVADFALSGRATGVVVQEADGSEVTPAALASFGMRTTAVRTGSRPLALAPLPIEEPLGRDTDEAAQLTLDGLVLELEPGRALALTGERADLPGVLASEVAILDEAIHAEGFTTLLFRDALRHAYLRRTVTVNANVVEATHGESVTELLGSGDGSVPHQRFTLKKPPLTHVPAADPSGVRSTLELRVNDLLWEGVPSLHGQPAQAHVYTLRVDDEGQAHILFGDGRQGARLPTGSDNVVARYRTGVGLEGEVEAGALTVLQGRPLGVRGVLNPVPASGGADPDSRDEAREVAPLTVRTMGRIVSLRDHADFARGFAGVGKAEARALWNGRGRVVGVTVGSAAGEPIPEESALFRELEAAMARVRAGFEPFRLASFQPLYFQVDAAVKVAPTHDPDRVLPRAEGALLERFSFTNRDFGAPVSASEVMAVLQGVEGVRAVRLDTLRLVTEPGAPGALGDPATVLTARPAEWDGEGVTRAQLLLAHPAAIELREMTP
jgi:predicted phage baseplate assembly protein